MKVSLKYITPNAASFIGEMAAICYDAKTDEQSNIRRARKCANDGHLATMRFAYAVFNVSGISRACSHQFVRSKHLDFLQRSQRYCKEGEGEVVLPVFDNDQQEQVYAASVLSSMDAYDKLIRLGVKKEDARFVLPEAFETELNAVGNLQAWKDFIKLRADKHAQWEIRAVAIEINNILAENCPELFERIE